MVKVGSGIVYFGERNITGEVPYWDTMGDVIR